MLAFHADTGFSGKDWQTAAKVEGSPKPYYAIGYLSASFGLAPPGLWSKTRRQFRFTLEALELCRAIGSCQSRTPPPAPTATGQNASRHPARPYAATGLSVSSLPSSLRPSAVAAAPARRWNAASHSCHSGLLAAALFVDLFSGDSKNFRASEFELMKFRGPACVPRPTFTLARDFRVQIPVGNGSLPHRRLPTIRIGWQNHNQVRVFHSFEPRVASIPARLPSYQVRFRIPASPCLNCASLSEVVHQR